MLAACRPADDAPAAQDVVQQLAEEVQDTVFTPAEDRVALPPARIYYTLTDHAWYARGEPLVHEGRAFMPAGMPVSASLTEMSQAGEFQGVEYYVRSGDADTAVYVPVFEGWWQPFHPDTAQTRG